MHLRHLALSPGTLTSYAYATHLQSLLVHTQLSYKARPPSDPTRRPPPDPTLLTFQTDPTYTCGRRETHTLTASQIAHLRHSDRAVFHPSQRGGLTTFHGPGQLTAFLVCALDRHRLRSASYVHLLEDSVIETCARFGVKGFTTKNPGVWVSETKKICAVGVHLRRYVSSFGVGLNVSTDLGWFQRIVACGLEGMETTSFEREGVQVAGVNGIGLRVPTVEEVGRVMAEEIARRLNSGEGVMEIEEDEVKQLENGSEWKGERWIEVSQTNTGMG